MFGLFVCLFQMYPKQKLRVYDYNRARNRLVFVENEPEELEI